MTQAWTYLFINWLALFVVFCLLLSVTYGAWRIFRGFMRWIFGIH